MPVSAAMGIDFLMAYRAIAWLCWIPNLLVAEWMIRSTGSARSRPAVLPRLKTPPTIQTDI
jgi:hypothetical protein